ncbi:MAG: hypothetical protein ACK5JH_05605 [Anaerocolumna sp.]
MLNNEKIRTMTKLAVYEDAKGKDDLKMAKYYKTDYVRLQVLKTSVNVTIGYVLILFLIAMYKADYLITKIVTLDFVRIGQYILGFYIIIMAIYITSTIIWYNFKYKKTRKNLSKYNKLLKKLINFYNQENING